MAFVNLVAELTGMLPGLSPLLAETYINRAWKDIRTARQWSFFVTDGVLVCPQVITDGTASITYNSASVTLDTDASAAVQDQITGAALPGILQLQIRFGTTTQLGGIYSIVAVDNTTPTAVVLTLDRVVLEATNSATAYQIYRCLVVPPLTDFKQWLSVVDLTNAIALVGQRVHALTSAMLDVRDPQRMAQGLAYNLASWGGNRISDPLTGATVPNATQNAGTPIYELWPHPTNGQTFYCRFRRAGADFSAPEDEQPNVDVVTDAMIVHRALGWHAYPFAAANVANFPQLKNANWLNLITDAKRDYTQDLVDAKRNDNDLQLQDVWARGHGLRAGTPFGRFGDPPYPIDSNFLQSHLVRF